MTEDEALDRLATLAGIEDGWWDFFGTWRPVSADTKRTFLTAMGVNVQDGAAVSASLDRLENQPWRRWLAPVHILDEGQTQAVVTIPSTRDKSRITWTLDLEDGNRHSGSVQVDTLPWIEEKWLDGVLVKRWHLPLPPLPLGYHRLSVTDGGQTGFVQTLIAAPAAAHLPDCLSDGRTAWGIATQIYALRGDDDWGVGTYTALGQLAEGAARQGAATVGINPLHALFPAQPEKFSPYAPSSRRFLNTAYLDVEAVPEFAECLEAKRMFASPGFQANLARLRGYPLVEYADLAQLQYPLLEVLYRWFRKTHLDQPDDQRGQDFRDFQAQGGAVAWLFCVFSALHEKFTTTNCSYWRHWPAEYQHPDNDAVTRFADDNAERVEFFWWLQFLADSQLGDAQRAALAAGAGIGLYRDLGVGIAGDGADAWMEQNNLALGVSVGAPPDPLALKGQNWGLVPFNPLALHEAAYAPFIAVMAANMRHAGALRLDHAMLLQRLYWVPPGADADQGAYVRYPVHDLFRLVALESRRHACLIIGEDLGTVPDGFRERMNSMSMFAYRVMMFEQRDGRFKTPDEFDANALSIFATHDLPSLLGYWNGSDIAVREKLDLYPKDGMGAEERERRAADRIRLVAALTGQKLLPDGFPTAGTLTPSQVDSLVLAVHLYLARAKSRLMMVQIEDILGQDSQMNVPGTTTQHPNWRQRFVPGITTILADSRLTELSSRLKDAGRSTHPRAAPQ